MGSHWVANVLIGSKYGKYDLTETAYTNYIQIHQEKRCRVAEIVSIPVSTNNWNISNLNLIIYFVPAFDMLLSYSEY